MNRIALATTAALVLSTGASFANDLVPGSDTTIRSAQSAIDTAVARNSFEAPASRTVSAFGYPAQDETLGRMVPASDTGIRARHNADDAAVARGTFGARSAAAFGYPAGRGAAGSDRADDRAANRTAGAPTTSMNGVLVPGSDSF